MAISIAVWAFLAGEGRPIEETVSALNVRVEIDPVTGFHDLSGAGHRVRLGAGLAFCVIDGRIVELSQRGIEPFPFSQERASSGHVPAGSLHGAMHFEYAHLKVYIRPLKAQTFAQAKAASERDNEERLERMALRNR